MVSKNIEENVNVENVINMETITTLNDPFLGKHKKKAMKKTKQIKAVTSCSTHKIDQ